MAIDSALKRKSISGVPLLCPGVTPNAAEPVAWRQASAWSYSGIAASVIIPFSATGLLEWRQMYHLNAEDMTRLRVDRKYHLRVDRRA